MTIKATVVTSTKTFSVEIEHMGVFQEAVMRRKANGGLFFPPSLWVPNDEIEAVTFEVLPEEEGDDSGNSVEEG